MRRGIVAKQELSSICENMMDNCLASNSDGGGVGCDNMTMIIVGLLGGRTKEQWYHDIAMRVANGDGPCAPPEYGKSQAPLHVGAGKADRRATQPSSAAQESTTRWKRVRMKWTSRGPATSGRTRAAMGG